MKMSYDNLMSPAFGRLFNAPINEYGDAMKIVDLRKQVMDHLKDFNEVKEKFAKSFGIEEGTAINESHPKFSEFLVLLSKEVNIEFDGEIELAIGLKVMNGMSANEIVLLSNFVKFVEKEEKEEKEVKKK